MTELDLNLLRVFDAMVAAGSVTDAADRLNLSIPATSRALGRLRRAVGDPVLVRAGRGMTPTPFALRTAPRVRSLLEEADALVTHGHELDVANLERSFTIRIDDGVATTLAPALVDAVAGQAPGVVLKFVSQGEESLTPLRDGSIDLDVGVGEARAPDLRSDLLYRERLVGVVRSDSPLGRRPTLAALCRYPHVSASRRGRTRGPLDDALARAGLRRRVAASVPSFAAAVLLVASSRLIGLVPHQLAERSVETLGLRWFPIPVELPAVDIALTWHARLDVDPAHSWLRELARSAVAG